MRMCLTDATGRYPRCIPPPLERASRGVEGGNHDNNQVLSIIFYMTSRSIHFINKQEKKVNIKTINSFEICSYLLPSSHLHTYAPTHTHTHMRVHTDQDTTGADTGWHACVRAHAHMLTHFHHTHTFFMKYTHNFITHTHTHAFL